jgi:hypothetical protein
MPQAEQTNTTPSAESVLQDVHEEVGDLETPLHEIRALAHAVFLVADGADTDEATASFQIVARYQRARHNGGLRALITSAMGCLVGNSGNPAGRHTFVLCVNLGRNVARTSYRAMIDIANLVRAYVCRRIWGEVLPIPKM